MRKLLIVCVILVFANAAQAGGILSRILDPQADVREKIDQTRAEQEARDRERQARGDEERDRLAREQEEHNRQAHEQAAREIQEARGKSLTVTYKRIPAHLQALACSDPEQQIDCKFYLAGFADTVSMMYAMNSKTNGICGDTRDLVHEFIQEVRTSPKARDAETHLLLFALLTKNHSCAKIKGLAQSNFSAGDLIDTCKTGNLGFNLCSQYQTGFISALLFLSEQTAMLILCGDQRLINSASLSNMLNDRLQANFKLRRDPAVTVMLNELMANMPCQNK
jgi:hypothetical protein